MAVDMYLKVAGVEGESNTEGYEKWFQITSFSFGVSIQASYGAGKEGGATGQPSISDLSITKIVDKSSPTLFKMCAAGDHFAKVELHVRKASLTYFKVELEPAIISSIQHGGSGGGDLLYESISFNCQQIKTIYQGQADKGAKGGGEIIGGYNIVKKKAI